MAEARSGRSGTNLTAEQRRAQGRRELHLWIAPEPSRALAELCERWGTSATGAIERALTEAAAREE